MQRLAENAIMDQRVRVATARARLCVAAREVRPVDELIRFVVGPGGTVVADLKRRLPGRGAWITARRRLVEEAVRRQVFGRAFKADVKVSPDLPGELDRLLEQSALDALSMAHKAGLVILGFEKTAVAAALVALIRARDAGEEYGHRLAAAPRRHADHAAEGKIIEAFTSAQLDLASGGLNVVHAALLAGRASETFVARWRLLEYYRADHPGNRYRGSRQQNGTIPEPGS